MFKITGLNGLSRHLDEAQKALSAIDGELGSISFDPHAPSSIDTAIQEMERLIDEQLEPYATNPIVDSLAQSIKEKYRQLILDKAAAARTSEDE